jgi:hypothetical protein
MNEVGVGSRIINFLTDTIIVFLLAYGLYKWWTFYVMFWDYKFFAFYKFFYATLFVYYNVFEMIWSRTPGKWLSMTKVRTTTGTKPAFYQVLIRSAARLILGVDPIFIAFYGKPLHDVLSKTRLVEA